MNTHKTENSINSILTPLDGSDNANVALDVAAEIAAKFEADLKILHVGQRQPSPIKALNEAANRSFELAEKSGGWTSDHKNWPRRLQVLDHMGQMILKEGQARAEKRGAQSIETKIDWGDEGERVLHHSKHPPVDMIVMGSRGASPLQGLFLGSVSHKVFTLAPCTCVTVRASEGQSELGTPQQIVVPFDGSGHALKAVDLACGLAEKFASRLKFVHVLQHDESLEHFRDLIDFDKLDPQTRQALQHVKTAADQSMETAFMLPQIPEDALVKISEQILATATDMAAARGLSKVDTEILDGSPAYGILDAINRDDADMVVLGMRGLGEVTGMILGSVSYKIGHLAPCTCITVR